MSTQSTSERIIEAALKLISEKGYKAATTRAIAELAGVNEVTIFRHFGNKRGLLKAIVDKFSYGPVLQKQIRELVIWDLETDLFNFSMKYQAYMMSIQKYVLIVFKEAGSFPELDEEIGKVPVFIKKELMNYLVEMQKRKKVIDDVDVESTAVSLIAMNFGYLMSRVRFGSAVSKQSTEEVLKTSVSIFSKGLTP